MLITNRPGGQRLIDRLSGQVQAATEIDFASAYVSPGACEALKLINRSKQVPLRLSVGRALQEGLAEPSRQYLVRLDQAARANGGGVRVCANGFHSKLYGLNVPQNHIGVVGSSNLTEHGLVNWVESNFILEGADADHVINESRRLWKGGVPITDCIDDIPRMQTRRISIAGIEVEAGDAKEMLPVENGFTTEGLTISLLDRNGQVPAKSGLNWGLGEGRPRDRYECYIRLPWGLIELAEFVFGNNHTGSTFYANTHDGKTLDLKLQGSQHGNYAKQISTLGNNSALGRWMVRDCLGITDGRAVTLEDLLHYGRTDVTFYRTDTFADGRAIVYIDFLPR